MLCKSCLQNKEADDFYKSNQTRCKECVKDSTKQNRLENLAHYRQYDRMRSARPDRVAAREAYAKTTEGKLAGARAKKKWAVTNAVRRKAHIILGNAVKAGKVVPQPCFVCGGKAEAHHPDYSEPLSVTWLCPEHHKAAHRDLAEIMHAAGKMEDWHY